MTDLNHFTESLKDLPISEGLDLLSKLNDLPQNLDPKKVEDIGKAMTEGTITASAAVNALVKAHNTKINTI